MADPSKVRFERRKYLVVDKSRLSSVAFLLITGAPGRLSYLTEGQPPSWTAFR
jgi:hypothetical protein